MLTRIAEPLRELDPAIPEPLANVVELALELERDDRYPDAATMLADLKVAAEGGEPPFAAACARGERPATGFAAPAGADPGADTVLADVSVETAAAESASSDAPTKKRTPVAKTEIGEPPVMTPSDEALTVPIIATADGDESAASAEAATAKRSAAKPVAAVTASKAAVASDEADEGGAGGFKLVAAAAVVLLLAVAWWRFGRADEETIDPIDTRPATTASAASPGASSAVTPEPDPTALQPVDPADPEAGVAKPRPGSPTPRPGLPPIPPGFPTSLPSGFPTALPSAIATALPTGLPTSLPTSIPTTFKWPPPPPATAPTPAPPAPPAPAPTPAPPAPAPPAPTTN